MDAPLFYGRQVLVPAAAALAQRYAGLGLDLRLSDRFADVIGEGLDAVLRVGQIADSGLVALPIGEQQLASMARPRTSSAAARLARPPTSTVTPAWCSATRPAVASGRGTSAYRAGA